MKSKVLVVAGLILTAISSQSLGAPVTFFGEDINTTGDPNQAPFTNATNARNNFFTNLTGVGTETFESLSTGTISPSVSFGAAGTATLTGGTIASGNDLSGRYPFSGTQYLNAGSDNFIVSFSNPIAAFGFYGIDIGDFGGQITLTLTDINNVISTLVVPNTIGSGGDTSGSNLYFGFFDTANTYKQVAFGNNSGGQDIFGFDDFSIGSLEQVTPGGGATPLPAALPLFASGAGVLSFLGWRRKRKTAAIAA